MNQFVFDFEKPIIELEDKIKDMKRLAIEEGVDISDEIAQLEQKASTLREDVYSNLTAWQRVQLARHPRRPFTLDYIERITTKFQEVHGDRLYADDHSLVTGFGEIDGRRVAIIGHQKGRGTKQNLYRNFGMPNPEGYRKAMRVMKLAEKFSIPIITFVDTFGAYPGLGAEERGQAEAIARNLYEMTTLKTPILTLVIGEGGSGGALAVSVADRIIMLEYSIYSVISPEGCASILYRDATMADKAAEALRLTAPDLMEFGIVDEIVPEPKGGAHQDWEKTAEYLKAAIIRNLDELQSVPPEELIDGRIEKYGKIGYYDEVTE